MKRQIELKIPDVGDADTIELVSWNIEEGQAFSEGDELCDLVTDKAAFSLEAPEGGKVIRILKQGKCQVKPGEKVAVVELN